MATLQELFYGGFGFASNGPLMAEPGRLPASTQDELIKRTVRNAWQDEERRAALKKWLVLCDSHHSLVCDKILRTHHSSRQREELRKYVTSIFNPAKDIINAIAIVWKNGARREVQDDENGTNAMMKLLNSGRLDERLQEWNRIAYFSGPVAVFPRKLASGRFTYHPVRKDQYEHVLDSEDPLSDPVAIAWTIRNGEGCIVVDGESWREYDVSRGPQNATLLHEEHYGFMPGTFLRFDNPADPFLWSSPTRHIRLVEGSVDVGWISTKLALVRKGQCNKLLTITGDLKETPEQQEMGDPENALIAPSDAGAAAVDIDALDFDTPPDGFMKHIRFITETLVESVGIPGSAVTFDTGSGNSEERMSFSHEGLTELRNEQIPFARRWELDLAIKSTKVAKLAGDGDLPSEEDLEERYTVEFGPLTRRFADPRVEIEWNDNLISKGLTSHIRMLRTLHPTLSEERLIELQRQILEEQAEFNEFKAERNLSNDPEQMGMPVDAMTLPQAQGKAGQMLRDKNKPKTKPNE